MDFLQKINIKDYDYILPEHRIAKYPLPDRAASKLIVCDKGDIKLNNFFSIGSYLPNNSLLVYNDTRVIHARLIFQKISGANIEIFCLEPAAPSDYQLAFSITNTCVWHCLIGNKKKWKNGNLVKSFWVDGKSIEFKANIESDGINDVLVRFSWNGNISFSEILQKEGYIPLPPYLNRKAEEFDKTRYQTVFSQFDGSVAAPTAGLHFTKEILNQFIEDKNICTEAITLHVGAGTFKPVSSAHISNHKMHKEHFYISIKLIKKIREFYGNITITGTTSLRAIESLYWLALKIYKNEKEFEIFQWDPYKLKPELTAIDALDFLINYCERNNYTTLNSTTSLMIVPGYEFKYANRLITNFHQPKSTLLLLVAAFIGDKWKDVYSTALNHDFRFLSYGDACLFIP